MNALAIIIMGFVGGLTTMIIINLFKTIIKLTQR